MTKGVRLGRRFFALYGAAGIWGAIGGGTLLVLGSHPLFGGLLIAIGIAMFALLVQGRLLRERAYTVTDVFFLAVPLMGVCFLGGIFLSIFPRTSIVVIYLVVFVILACLAGIEAWRAARADSAVR
jgi:hypothetical protein